jgi:hypothetical protein
MGMAKQFGQKKSIGIGQPHRSDNLPWPEPTKTMRHKFAIGVVITPQLSKAAIWPT